jgi:signal transduction histidine kinase
MKTLKSKIQTPFLIVSFLIPLATLIIFNISIRVYIDTNAKNAMKTTQDIMDNTQLIDYMSHMPLTADNNFDKLLQVLVDVNVIVYYEQEQPICVNNPHDNFTNAAILQHITEQLPKLQNNKINAIRVNSKKYYVTVYTYDQAKIVFIAQTDSDNDFIKVTNLFLLIIMFCGGLIAFCASHIISNRIATQVRKLCSITEQIGDGEFIFNRDDNSNILELNQLHHSIIQMSMQLEAYDKTQKTFLQNASHELKTPLMSIQGYAEGIENGILKDTKQAAHIINSESIRLNKLVSELLTLSRIESRTYSKELTSINLNNILKEYMQRLGGLAAKQNIQLLLTLPDTPIYVLADDELLSQAVINIASNCIRHAKNTVQITLMQKDKEAIIRILDDGNGILPEELPHIFERFYKGKNGSLGLGLSIAQTAINFLGGTIEAQSNPTGAIFDIALNTL